MSQAIAFYIYRADHVGLLGLQIGGHYCGATALGQYAMPHAWIDTDNKVWAEPTHLYTTFCAGLSA